MSATKYQRNIAKLISELAGYDHVSVIEAAVNSLISKRADGVDTWRRLPWIQFFLLKLALLGESGAKKMGVAEFNRFANRLYSVQSDAAGLSASSVQLQLRPMILQQMWYQRDMETTTVALIRQRLFFIGKNEWYALEFEKRTGLKLNYFYAITIYILTVVRDHDYTAVNINLFELLHKLCPAIPYVQILNYFALVGVRTADLPGYVKMHKLDGVHQSEYFQDTPLKGKPILVNGEHMLVVDIHMFAGAVGDFVPDFLKRIPYHKDYFGPDFQDYIDGLLGHAELSFWREQPQLEGFYKQHGLTGKIVDFLVEGPDRIVLVECKAIEPSPVVKTASNPLLLKKNLEESFIKGIKQGVHAAYGLGSTPRFAGKKFSLLIVTHEDFGIYGGRWVADFIEPELSSWMTESYPGVMLSLDDIFYCTVEDFENLTRGHLIGVCDFHAVVASASTAGIDPIRQRLVFNQHLSEQIAGSIGRHPPLAEEIHDCLGGLSSTYMKNRKYWGSNVAELILTRNHLVANLNFLRL